MRIFEIELSNLGESGSSTATTVSLPATWTALNDALQKARIPDDRVIYAVEILNSQPKNLIQMIPKHANLYELNHFAERLDKLQDWQMTAFEGLVKMDAVRTDCAPIPVARLINMTHSLVECQVVYEAHDDESLGRFYAENGFVPELEMLSEKVFPWLDYAKIGKEMREAESGVFTPSGYVVQNGEMSEEYSFDTAIFDQKPDCVFLLEIAPAPKNDRPNDANCATLKLPATIDDMENALEQIGASSLQECVFYRFDSLVPSLATVFGDMDNFKDLNDLAQEIQTIDSHGELPKFKALLEAAEWNDLCHVTELARNLDSYHFDAQMVIPREYAESVLEKLDIPLQRKFFDMAVLDAYGEELMEYRNIHSTDYGFISCKDGEPMMLQEQDSPTMTMR